MSAPARRAARTASKAPGAPRHPPTAHRAIAWSALALLAVGVAAALRTYALGSQIVIDDEWHGLHKVMRSNVIGILTHLDYADFSIPVALYYRALQETVGITEWTMRAPMVVAGVALVALAPWLARGWTSRGAGVAWSVLLAISPMLAYLSRTARPYAITALTSTIAIVAFERWWRGDERRRTRWAVAYVAAAVLGGWLHMLSLAFTLTPFLYFGARSLRDRGALARLFRLGLVTAALLALVLLPPLVNDWRMFAAKAGQDAVTPDTLERSVLMVAGTGHAIVGIAFAALVLLGWHRWWTRDRDLAGYALTVVLVGSAAIVVARPNWVQYALVFARYLIPVVPLLLLLAAEGLVRLLPRQGPLAACVVAAVAVALVASGPLPLQWYAPNQFTSHQRFQFDYDDAHNPYVTQRVEGVPPFYRELARAPAGSLTVVVAPWRLESHLDPHVWYQATHRQHVKIGMLTPMCGRRDFGEYPQGERGMRLATMVSVETLLRDPGDATFLVVHLRPWSTPPGQDVPWPALDECLPAIERALGAPVYRDDEIVAFALRR